jgi:hypothetical protein
MLGRKTYTRQELDHGQQAINGQLAAYDELRKTVGNGKASRALAEFDSRFFNALLLTLDRLFVHRLAGPNYEGKDGNALNEVRIIVDSLISNDGKMRADKQIKLTPEKSVTGLEVGDSVVLTREQLGRLSEAFFSELERRFLEG